MTIIYTKPQIDAMAVKIGGEIKAAKTTVTQVQGQSTTEVVSQKLFTDTTNEINLTIESNNAKQESHISLKTDENNHIIGQGKAESATVYDLSLRSDKVRVSAPTDVEFGKLVFKTYAEPTTVNSVIIPKGTWLNPELVTPLLGTAATRDVGTGADQVPLSKNIFKVNSSKSADTSHSPGATGDCNNFALGTAIYFGGVSSMPGFLNTPRAFMDYFTIHTFSYNSAPIQMAFSYDYSYSAAFRARNYDGIWGEWKALGESKVTYNRTTAAGANVAVGDDGRLYRSTSSERYKDILAPFVLDDARYADAMSLNPIVYRSTADADNPTYHYYSFSAEELGAYDPAFTLWRETETVTDEDGNVIEQPLAERQAEGININALLAMSHAIAIKQGELIKDLQEQINTLKPQTEV